MTTLLNLVNYYKKLSFPRTLSGKSNTYIISSYKILVELLLSIKAHDEQFVKKFQEQIKTLIESLSQEEQETLSTAMKKEQDIALTELLTIIGKSLTEVDRKQFLANIESLKTSV